MADSPLYVKLAPGFLLGLAGLFGYVVSEVVSFDFGSTAPVKSITEAVEKIDKVKRFFEELNARPVKLKKGQRLDQSPLSTKKDFDTIFSFYSMEQAANVELKGTRGGDSSFSLDDKTSGPDSGMSGLLAVTDFGPDTVADKYASMVITLPDPALLNGKTVLRVTIRGEGVTRIGIGLVRKEGSDFLHWNIGNYVITAGKWHSIDIPFSAFNLWEYNSATRKYRKAPQFRAPEVVDQIRFYLKPGMVISDAPKLWVGSIAVK